MEEGSLMGSHEAKKRLEQAVRQLQALIRKCASAASWAKPISPTCAPTPWNCINATCCLSTAVFLVLGLRGHAMAELCYVPFNLVICVLWLAEAALWILFDEGDPLWQKMGELLLAGYYIIDGVIYYYEWAVLKIPPTNWDIIVYSVIDISIYIFYFVLGSYPELLTDLIPSNPTAILEQPSNYKYAFSTTRRFLVWWLPTAITMMWLTYSQGWNERQTAMILAAGVGSTTTKGSTAVFLAANVAEGSMSSLLQTI